MQRWSLLTLVTAPSTSFPPVEFLIPARIGDVETRVPAGGPAILRPAGGVSGKILDARYRESYGGEPRERERERRRRGRVWEGERETEISYASARNGLRRSSCPVALLVVVVVVVSHTPRCPLTRAHSANDDGDPGHIYSLRTRMRA